MEAMTVGRKRGQTDWQIVFGPNVSSETQINYIEDSLDFNHEFEELRTLTADGMTISGIFKPEEKD